MWTLMIGSLLVLTLSGCATAPVAQHPPSPLQAIPTLRGSYHEVRPGETLWRIAHSYGLEAHALAAANRLPSASALHVGQRLFVPLPADTQAFLWPVRGELRTSSASHGIEITAQTGNLVRASRRGRVAVATRQLAGWGTTVVLDHFDGYLTIYSGLERLLVAPGIELLQGMPIGSLGSRALHFEIRYGEAPRNTLALLPRE